MLFLLGSVLLVDAILLLTVLAAKGDVSHLGVTSDREGKQVTSFVTKKPDLRAVEASKIAKVVALRYNSG